MGRASKIVNGFFVGSFFVMTAYAGSLYYHPDYLGSSTLAASSSGVVAQEVSFTPFGESLSFKANSKTTNYLYTGKESDRFSDLHDYGARYYDAVLARFLSVDPLLDSVNPYAYVSNNPVAYIDPTGQRAVTPSTGPSNSMFFQATLGFLVGLGPGYAPPSMRPNNPYFRAGYEAGRNFSIALGLSPTCCHTTPTPPSGAVAIADGAPLELLTGLNADQRRLVGALAKTTLSWNISLDEQGGSSDHPDSSVPRERIRELRNRKITCLASACYKTPRYLGQGKPVSIAVLERMTLEGEKTYHTVFLFEESGVWKTDESLGFGQTFFGLPEHQPWEEYWGMVESHYGQGNVSAQFYSPEQLPNLVEQAIREFDDGGFVIDLHWFEGRVPSP